MTDPTHSSTAGGLSDADFLTSPLLTKAGFTHAFFTRRGGVSPDPYRSLNFSSALGDTVDNVARNLARGARVLGIEPSRIHFLSQVHGTDVHEVGPSDDREATLHTSGDALVSRSPGVACAVRTADCVPVLFADPPTGMVAAAHAGWRGAAKGVVAAAVRRLLQAGAEGPLLAAIGPHISLASFEVSAEVAKELLEASPDPGIVDESRGPRPHVDLRRMIRAQLLNLGFDEGAVDDVPGCTVSDASLFFSYRRDGKIGGRHLSAIVARSPLGT